MKLIKIFSEHTGEETRLYSVPRFQKEFNSKAQKELRRRLDLERGLEYSKLDPAKEYPKDIIDEGIRRGRSLNSQPVQTKNLKERAKELKKAKRIKFLKKGAKASAIGIGAVGIGVGIKKAVDNHKEKKLLKEYREQLKTYSDKRFSQRESLEDIYKTILNPIILEADKVYGKKSLYIPRLLENGETKEGKTLLIGQHPDADLRSDSCYEIFDGLWKDSSGKYWTEKSGFLGRKTWKEVEDPKKYMSEIYRGFNISSRDLSKVCGNLSKAIYEDSLDKIKGNPQYWKLPEIKYF